MDEVVHRELEESGVIRNEFLFQALRDGAIGSDSVLLYNGDAVFYEMFNLLDHCLRVHLSDVVVETL